MAPWEHGDLGNGGEPGSYLGRLAMGQKTNAHNLNCDSRSKYRENVVDSKNCLAVKSQVWVSDCRRGKKVKADDFFLLHGGAEGHSGPIHGARGVGVVRRKIQEGNLENSFGKTGFEITLRHANADFQLTAGDPGYHGRIMKSKGSHTKQYRFSPCS